MKHAFALLLASSITALSAPTLASECRITGTGEIYGMTVRSTHEIVSMVGEFTVTLRPAGADVSAIRPLEFQATTALADVALAIHDATIVHGVLGIAAGVGFVATSVDGDEVVGTIDNNEGLIARGVRVPCASLALRRGAGTTSVGSREPDNGRHAPVPTYNANRRWISSTRQQLRTVCHTSPRGHWRECHEEPINRCSAIGDGSECGYHPSASTHLVRVFAAPNAASPSAEIQLHNDVVLQDQDGRRGWLLVQTLSPQNKAVIVRGWVRRADVVWRQEVPEWLRTMGVGNIGTIGIGRPTVRGARQGYVRINVSTNVVNQARVVWARAVQSYCSEAMQAPNTEWVQIDLPGRLLTSQDPNAHRTRSQGFVIANAVEWVENCTP